MNKLEKFGYFLVGFGIGGLVVSFLYERELEKPVGEVEEYIPKYEDTSEQDETNEENEPEFDEVYSNKSSLDIQDTSKHVFRRDRSNDTPYNTMYRGKVEKKSPPDIYNTIIKDVELGEDDSPDDDMYEFDQEAEDNDLVRERVENNFEIYLGENPQDFVTLIYYEGDDTLADDQEEIVPDIKDTVGQVAIERLIEGGSGAEEGVIYVRNLKTMINYEIVLDAGSYSETVLGLLNSRRNKGAGKNGNIR